MKTALLFLEIPESHKFFILDGDYTHLIDVYIGLCSDEDKQTELSDLIFDNNAGDFRHAPVSIEDFEAAIRDGAKFIVCGMIM